MRHRDSAGVHVPERRPRPVGPPRPHIAKPDGRQQVQRRRIGPAVVDRDSHEHVFGRRLGVFHEHVEVAVVIEDPGVEQLVFEVVTPACPVGVDDLGVRICRLGILVEVLHVRVGRRGVEVEVVLLHVLAVVPLAVGQAEQALLQDRILAVPERQREAQQLLVVRDAGQAVFTPSIGTGPRLIVAEVTPRVAVRAVVLAHGAPLALAQVRSPLPPRNAGFPGFDQAGGSAPVLESGADIASSQGLTGNVTTARDGTRNVCAVENVAAMRFLRRSRRS